MDIIYMRGKGCVAHGRFHGVLSRCGQSECVGVLLGVMDPYGVGVGGRQPLRNY